MAVRMALLKGSGKPAGLKDLLAVVLLGGTVVWPLRAADFRIGVAAVDITPPLGIPMAGYYHARGADGVLDPLSSKAMVIEQEGQRIALVTLDTISITRAITDRARAEIEKTASIRGDHVMISATHAHTGPELANTSKFSSDLGGQKQIALDYTEGLPKLIAESVRLANERLEPARLSVAKGRCDGLAFNCRYFMRDGSTGWNPCSWQKCDSGPRGRGNN
jgi:hypothetical protein